MRIRKIPKGGGRFRTIYVPNLKEKERLRKLLPLLHEIHQKAVDAAGTRGIAHAFVPHRNPVTCALPHRGFQVTISCDLENWFDTVTDQHLLMAGMPPEIVDAITIPDEQGVRRCRQGLPTSPVAANIAAVAMDNELFHVMKWLADSWKIDFAYTRYADDITVSASHRGGFWTDGVPIHPALTDMILARIYTAAGNAGWTIAEHKTHIQHAKAGRRIIVGIAVDDRVHATRKTRRKLRAAQHQGATKTLANGNRTTNLTALKSAAGIAEWAACKLPRRVRSTRQMMGVLAGSGSVASPTEQTQTVAISGSGRRVLVPVRDKIADDSANR